MTFIEDETRRLTEMIEIQAGDVAVRNNEEDYESIMSDPTNSDHKDSRL